MELHNSTLDDIHHIISQSESWLDACEIDPADESQREKLHNFLWDVIAILRKYEGNFVNHDSQVKKEKVNTKVPLVKVPVDSILKFAEWDLKYFLNIHGMFDMDVQFYIKNIRGNIRTTCVIKFPSKYWYSVTKVYQIGRSTCSRHDDYYPEIGKIISYRRAMGADVPEIYTTMVKDADE